MNIWQSNLNIREFQSDKGDVPYTNTSLIRSTHILLCLSNGINASTEIAKYCRYSTSTVHRLLNVLKSLNWVIQDATTHKYYLGPVVNQLAANQSGMHRYLLINALHEMERLSSFSEETINLSILVQLRSILLHTIPSEHELKITEVKSGYGVLFAVGATGKELLSQLQDEEIREILHKVDLAKVTGNNITDRKVLIAQLKDIRRQGYAISYGERISGALCVSAGIKNYTHPAALSILGPESRLKPRLKEIIERLVASTRRISNSLTSTY